MGHAERGYDCLILTPVDGFDELSCFSIDYADHATISSCYKQKITLRGKLYHLEISRVSTSINENLFYLFVGKANPVNLEAF